jgi:hypothetical protein
MRLLVIGFWIGGAIFFGGRLKDRSEFLFKLIQLDFELFDAILKFAFLVGVSGD